MMPTSILGLGVDGEIAALIATLHENARRLEELTDGEVDTVANREGRTFMLRPAQDYLRHNEAAKQAAIIDALPAHIALLDNRGEIISVNAAWRVFASANALSGADYQVGVNYLEICDSVQGEEAAQARQVAAGIRAVLAGEENKFSLEYSCNAPNELRWFLMTVTPLAKTRPHGAVVMHMDVTERKRAALVLNESERRLSDMLGNVELLAIMLDGEARITYCNDFLLRLSGWELDEVVGRQAFELLIPRDGRQVIAATFSALLAGDAAARHSENELLTRSGERRLVRWNNSLLRSASGEVIGAASIGEDITERKRAAVDLRASESRFRSLVELSTDWYWEQDESLRFVTLSGGDRVEGWDDNQRTWVGLRRWDIPGIVPLSNSWKEHKALLYAHEAFRNFEFQRQAADGSVRYVSASGEPIFDAEGYFDGYRGVATDITARKAADARIAYLNRVYAMLSGINTLIVRVHDRDELFREACRIAVETGGFRMALIALVDSSTSKVVPVATMGKDDELLQAVNSMLSSSDDEPNTMLARAVRDRKPVVVNDTRSDPRFSLNERYLSPGLRSMAAFPLTVMDKVVGVLALYAGEIDFFHAEEVTLFTELSGDIAFAIDHIDKQERLDYLAYYDPLTGLANRNLFLDRLGQHLRHANSGGHQVAMALIDLERFKNINDSLGRPAGDALLKQVAEWLTRNALGDASLLARISADLFAFVMPVVYRDGNLAELMQKSMEQLRNHPFRLNDAVFRIAAKIGITLYPDDGTDAETLLRNAEAALKRAKASGERYLFYTHNMTAAVAGKLTLENQLRHALDNGEFVLHYQPKVNLISGKITSAEALIRWNDPHTGLVPPGRFIPMLEETGLIYEVGRWALRQAIADYLRWRNAGLPAVRIAVNVSPLQLRNRNFIEEVEHAITIDPMAADGLELEITESLIMEDVNHSIASLHAIRAMGISIAIDDFGTGFSSLSYLAKLPVDTLKIDRSFVIEMTDRPQGLALVSTIISLAHALKLKVVAEGVETEEQHRLLHLLNCDEMQGYLFSEPVSAELFEAMLLVPLVAG